MQHGVAMHCVRAQALNVAYGTHRSLLRKDLLILGAVEIRGFCSIDSCLSAAERVGGRQQPQSNPKLIESSIAVEGDLLSETTNYFDCVGSGWDTKNLS